MCISADRDDVSAEAMSCIGTLYDGTQLWISNASFLPRCAHRPGPDSHLDDVCSSKDQLLNHLTCYNVPRLRAHVNNKPVL